MEITLKDCPVELQKEVAERTEAFKTRHGSCELISVSCQDGHPYKDAERVLRTYEVILLVGNMFAIYSQMIDGVCLDHKVMENTVIAGTVSRIVKAAPAWFDFS